MTTNKQFQNILGQSCCYGMVVGVVVALVYAYCISGLAIFYTAHIFIIAGIVGVISGLIAGLLEGTVIGLIAICISNPLIDAEKFRGLVGAASAAVAFGIALGLVNLYDRLALGSPATETAVWTVSTATILALAAGSMVFQSYLKRRNESEG